ncbi:MAG: S41 family peptidase [Flavobacterium circumlabens]|uniref:S41 family peptidase n=1 Tax=Flavobacterium circumlabens TaxID=2133765 RepID=UPI003265E39A
MKIMYYILAVGLGLSLGTVNAQKLEIEKLTKEDYLSDLQLMKEIIETQHPDPFRFQSKQQWENNFAQTIKNIKNKPEYLEFLNNIPKISDGHLSVSTPDEFNIAYIKEKLSYFPIPLILLENRLFVNVKCEEVPFLSEIISINGRTTLNIITQMSRHIQGEGAIKTGIEDQISDDFVSSYSYYVEPYVKTFDIEYKEPLSQEHKKTTLNASDYYKIYYKSSQKASPINRAEINNFIDYQFYKKELTGKLTVNTFELSEQMAYQNFSDFFKRVNKESYKNVIIDLRNNKGGNPQIAAILYSFITKSNFENKFNFKAKTITLAHPEFVVGDNGARVSESEIRDYENFLYQRFNLKDGMYIGNERLKEGVTENFPADKDTFSGNVFIVTSGNTYSAAVYFAKLVQDNKRGTLVGKETGGNANNTFAGYFLNYKLPKTRAILRFSFTDLYFGENPPKINTGIIPEISLTTDQRINYLAKEKDPEINYILEKLIIKK